MMATDSFYYEYERQGVRLALIARESKPGRISVARIDTDGSFTEPREGDVALLDHPSGGEARCSVIEHAAQHWESWESVLRELQIHAMLRMVLVPAEA